MVAKKRVVDNNISAADAIKLRQLGEPLFLLHCGDGDSAGDWDTEANSGRVVDELTAKHPGRTLGLYDETAVLKILQAEREWVRKVILDDVLGSSFNSTGYYRRALLEVLKLDTFTG